MAQTLAGLSPDEWATPSLCAGWTVKHVAAHVIATPQMRPFDVAVLFLRNLGRSYNAMIDRDVQQRAQQPVEQILADYERYATSRSKVFTTTTVEPLIDVLVHHQDVVRPLGLRHDMPVEAAVVALARARLLSPLSIIAL